jgi:hypothetical protein
MVWWNSRICVQPRVQRTRADRLSPYARAVLGSLDELNTPAAFGAGVISHKLRRSIAPRPRGPRSRPTVSNAAWPAALVVTVPAASALIVS